MSSRENLLNKSFEDEVKLSAYWDMIRHKIWHILGLAIITTLLAAVLVSTMPPIYKSTVVLLLEPEQAKTVSLAALFNVGKRSIAYFNTQRTIISSSQVLGKVISKLNLDKDTELLPVPSKPSVFSDFLKLDKAVEISAEKKHQLLLAAFRKHIDIVSVRQTNLIEISYESASAKQAAKVANALANAYIQDSVDVRAALSVQTTSWMRERMVSLKKQLSLSEGYLQDFIEKEKLVNLGEGVDTLIGQELAEQSKYILIAKAKIAELSVRYGNKHPKIIAAKRELSQAENAMERGKEKNRALDRKSSQLKELQHEVESTRQLYDAFLNRVKETDESSTLKTAAARIIDLAAAPLYPIKPNKKKIIMAAFFVTVMLGIALVLLLNMLDSTIRSVEQIESKLGLVLLGLLPLLKFKTKGLSRADILKQMIEGEHHLFTESARTIRTAVMLSAIDNPHKVLLVTSSVPGEGKSTVAANLAFVMGKMEKVLLIDADLRRPTVAKSFGMKTKECGLSELVAGTAGLDDCIEKDSGFGIDVMHAGVTPPNPLELIASKRFKEILNFLERKYDRIIIDSAPVQVVSDSLVMSKYARGVIYVVKADSTSEHVVKTCIKRLNQVDAPIIGVVLNQFDTTRASKNTHYGYGNYYDQYGYTQQQD